MYGSVKCVENQGRNIECMHVKCKSIVIIMWNNYIGIKFHFYHLTTILWGNFFCFFLPFNKEKVFYKFICCIAEENIQMSGFVIQFINKRVC